MSTDPSHANSNPPHPRDSITELESLRRILLTPEQSRLAELEERIAHSGPTSDQVSELLPLAVTKAAARDQKLAQALAPTLTKSFQESVSKNPQALVDVVFPIIGPAIRRSIKEALSGLVQTLNATLEQSLSWQGLQWRLEAVRTGRSFGEVVMLKTLLYRVEHAFLIHSRDGLLLKHVTSLSQSPVHADMISGMLTAIQDFVRDSFGGQDSGNLKEVEVGDKTVWMEQGPLATLALVISGHPPQEVRELMQLTLESIHRDFHHEFLQFRGDNAPFVATSAALERCLVSASRERRQSPNAARIARGILAGTLIGFVVLTSWLGWQAWRWNQAHQLANLRRFLQTPASVRIQRDGATVRAEGAAHAEWLKTARATGPSWPGIKQVDLTGVKNVDEPWERYLRILRKQPGIIITTATIGDDHYEIEGLRDPLAEDPQRFLVEAGLSPRRVRAHWAPFQSGAPELVERHAIRLLNPPADVQVLPTDRGLILKGRAPHGWIESARQASILLKGQLTLELDQVTDVDREELVDRLAQLEQFQFSFPRNSSELTKETVEKLGTAADLILAALRLADRIDAAVTIQILGGVIPSETSAEEVFGLSYSRARAIRYHLIGRSVPREVLLAMSAHDALEQDAPAGTPNATGWIRATLAKDR